MSCTASTVSGLLFAFVGAGAFYFGILCWTKPKSKIVQDIVFAQYAPEAKAGPINRFFGMTRESAGPAALWVWRFLGPINGSVFFVVGLWEVFGQTQCSSFHSHNMLQIFGPLEFTFWPPTFLFAFFGGASAFWSNRNSGFPWSLSFGLFGLCFGLAIGEAVGFHIGIQADRWFLVAIAVVILNVMLYAMQRLVTKAADQ